MMYDATNRSHKIIRRGLRKGEQTRREINPQGGAGAALSDLMKATGLEKGGIYRHFDSKQQLAVEAFELAWKLALDTRFKSNRESLSGPSLQPLVTPFVVGHAGVTGAATHFDLLLFLICQTFSGIPGESAQGGFLIVISFDS